LRTVTNCEPTITLEAGLAETYAWILGQLDTVRDDLPLSRTHATA
jgi:hypothetical protein